MRMKLNDRTTNQSQTIAEQALSLMDNLRSTGISIEIDEEMGVSIVHDMGAVGATPDMPRDIASMYLADQVGSIIGESPVRG